MATFKGSAGSVSFAATVIGELKAWTLSTEVDLLVDIAMGDKWDTQVGGIARWNGSATAHLDYDDAQQAAIIVDIMAATPTGDSVAMIFLVATGKTFTGNALVQSVSITQTIGEIVEVTFNFVGNGALAPTWA